MAEVTYRAPGFFEAEIDLSGDAPVVPSEKPAGIIGVTPYGAAFLPTRITSLNDFVSKFGDAGLDRSPAYYAVQEYFKNGDEVTFVRVLGAGANSTTSDITETTTKGTVKAAGFAISGTAAFNSDGRSKGSVQFITAKHSVNDSTDESYPIFVHNDSFPNALGDNTTVNLVRGVVLLATGTRMQILNETQSYSVANTDDDIATLGTNSTFKLVISSSATAYGTTDGSAGIKIYTASLDPDSDKYISKILNTSPELFQQTEHLLYTHFPVDMLIASASSATSAIAIVSGSSNTSATSGDSTIDFQTAFGKFNTRFSASRTSLFLSQPYGKTAKDLFYFETLAHGNATNNQVKISITNLMRSTDTANPYGTFTVLVRDYYDDDVNIKILEQFSNCDLNPSSDNFVLKKIGDKKTFFNFDASSTSERRLKASGTYANKSNYVRIIGTDDLKIGLIPQSALPFGFEGLPVLKTSDSITDTTTTQASRRLALVGSVTDHTASIVPPVPLRFKVTSGDVKSTATFIGQPGDSETVDARQFWGIQFERITSQLQPNAGACGQLIDNLVKFAGISKLDTVTTGSSAGAFCNNRFSLSRVSLYNTIASGNTLDATITANITGTVSQHMLETAYIRNGVPDSPNYTINDTTLNGDRITFATLLAATDTTPFNRFSNFMKFTNVFYGGFDGTNILNTDMSELNDKSTSSEFGGLASGVYNIGLSTTANTFGTSTSNSAVNSYITAVNIITSKVTSRINTLTVPGIRDTAITDYAFRRIRDDYQLAFYIMDIPSYNDSNTRIFDTTTQPDVTKVISNFLTRGVNNRYTGTYFPDATIITSTAGGTRRVRVPASVVALGAIAQNDKLGYPWYAPAGFNRASLADVTGLATRLTSDDRDVLYDARINPITTFPGAGFVIFGQKTLQSTKSALDRVNVVRLVIEVSRQVMKIGIKYVFGGEKSLMAFDKGRISHQANVENYWTHLANDID